MKYSIGTWEWQLNVGILMVSVCLTLTTVCPASSLLGKPVYDESGELVCTKPFPSMPTHFWNDEDYIKYHKSYFSLYSGLTIIKNFKINNCVLGVWAHGDYCRINSITGGIVMLGRRSEINNYFIIINCLLLVMVH